MAYASLAARRDSRLNLLDDIDATRPVAYETKFGANKWQFESSWAWTECFEWLMAFECLLDHVSNNARRAPPKGRARLFCLVSFMYGFKSTCARSATEYSFNEFGDSRRRGIWVADVIFIHDDDLNVYWMSHPECRHSKAILETSVSLKRLPRVLRVANRTLAFSSKERQKNGRRPTRLDRQAFF